MISCAAEKISVFLLTYNHVGVIESTLKTILDQTITGYEVFVSDDCSTDGTWELLLELAEDDPRIKPIKTPRNLGMPGNANFAVSHSERPYIALLHHDDLYRRDLLEKWVNLAEQYQDIAFLFNEYGVYESNDRYSEAIPSGRVDGNWFLQNHLLPRWGCAVRGTAMIRRKAWEDVGGMREQFGLLADIDLWMRLSMRWDVGYVAEPIIMVRHQRPSYYPDDYKGNAWSWRRQRFLYEIHARNRLQYFRYVGPIGKLKWWGFRLKLSSETAKWLIYSVIRRKPEIIKNCDESETAYDLLPLRMLRWGLKKIYAITSKLATQYRRPR